MTQELQTTPEPPAPAGEPAASEPAEPALADREPAGSSPAAADPGQDPDSADSEPVAAGVAGQPPRKRRLGLVIAALGGAAGVGLIALVGLAAVTVLSEDPPAVGECLTESLLADEMAVVDCADAEAYWTVVGDDGVWTHGEFESAPLGEMCAEHPGTLQALWVTNARGVTEDTEGDVVCLEPLGPVDDPATP